MSSLSITPKDVFLRLFNILVFYMLVTSFITLCIQYVNVGFPDALNYYFDSIAGTVRFASAMLIIVTPAYLLSSSALEKDMRKTPAKHNLGLVKWLVYLTLFVAAVTIVIDLITFVYNFLSGELTIQFFLKIMIVLIVAVAVFAYFLWDLQRTNLKSHTPKILAWSLLGVVFLSVIAGFFIIGTPFEQRARRFDSQRLENLQMLQGEIVNFWTQKDILPEDLSALQNSISGFIAPQDPETNADYEYTIKTPLIFELCATFMTVSDGSGARTQRMSYPYDMYQQNWAHKAERTCFERVIDPELYRPKPILER
ncbi:MAG: DUF5671 domain-containing protein [Candidatus Peregrinibacteria bacterium]|nr:DUF5671 domain-containing protein [Candidatus Peregrinibacteria bacterium]MDZ4244492.1 DUF5671 domain-containing protein [Candidatus Gracilibacteria bacterium]